MVLFYSLDFSLLN